MIRSSLNITIEPGAKREVQVEEESERLGQACHNCGGQAWFNQQGEEYEGNFCSEMCADQFKQRSLEMANMESIPVTPGAIKALAARYKYQMDRLATAAGEGNEKVLNMATQSLGKIEEEAANLGLQLKDLLATDTSTTVVTNGKVTPTNPVVPKDTRTKAQKDADKVAARAKAIAAEKVAQGTASVRKEKKPPRPKMMRPCLDGCGQMVGGNFWMGHDAKLKSLIIKVERGEEPQSNIPDIAQDLIKFKKGETEEIRDSKGKLIEKRETWICTAAPVRFPGRADIAFTERAD